MSQEQLITKVLEQLKSQVLNLLDDLLIIAPNESDLLLIRLFFENQIEPTLLMEGFIKWVYPWKNEIETKNESFFRDNDHIFGPLPTSKVKYIKERIEDGTLDEDDKETMWKYFQVFIKLIEQYKKLK